MPDVMIQGPEGFLQGRYFQGRRRRSMALILHPHPLQGGTMQNRVCHAMYETFKRLDYSVLRFNFRGVGRSQGRFDAGIGEISDAAAALEWLHAMDPKLEDIWVAGYSFGAFIGMQLLMRRPEISGWISVAPPVNHYDFNFLQPCPCNGMIIHGADDTLVPSDSVRKLVDKLNGQRNIEIDYRVMDGADHVFGNRIDHISAAVEDYATRHIQG